VIIDVEYVVFRRFSVDGQKPAVSGQVGEPAGSGPARGRSPPLVTNYLHYRYNRHDHCISLMLPNLAQWRDHAHAGEALPS
jgi:hypothetical protein